MITIAHGHLEHQRRNCVAGLCEISLWCNVTLIVYLPQNKIFAERFSLFFCNSKWTIWSIKLFEECTYILWVRFTTNLLNLTNKLRKQRTLRTIRLSISQWFPTIIQPVPVYKIRRPYSMQSKVPDDLRATRWAMAPISAIYLPTLNYLLTKMHLSALRSIDVGFDTNLGYFSTFLYYGIQSRANEQRIAWW